MPASPFQASGETSPGKNDDLPRTIAGSTPLPLGRRSFAVSGPLAPVRSASYPVPVRRLTGSFHASFSVRLTTNALRFPSVPATRFREDFHLQVIAHAGPTTAEITPSASGQVRVEVAEDVAEDEAGNPNRAAEPLVIEADVGRPEVTIEGPTEPVGMEGFEVTIAFSEPVAGLSRTISRSRTGRSRTSPRCQRVSIKPRSSRRRRDSRW